jgi:predicted XRE-type DNA-binding protein
MSKPKKKSQKSSGNVFADLGIPHAEAENLLVRAKLIAAIKLYINEKNITQAEAAERFNVAQPRMSEIYQGKIELFSVDKLIIMLAQVGQSVEVTVYNAA